MMQRRDFTLGLGAAAVAGTPAARAQPAPQKAHRIAIYHPSRRASEMTETGPPVLRAFFQELRRLGYVEGRNLTLQRFSAEGRQDRYAEIAREIVSTSPDLIVVNGGVGARVLQPFTSTIPIVAAAILDPLAQGLVRSIARPGGNVTGFTIDGGVEISGLRIQWLKEVAPAIRRIAHLSTRLSYHDAVAKADAEAAEKLRLSVTPMLVEGTADEAGYRRIFSEIGRGGFDAIYVGVFGENITNRRVIIDQIAALRLPAIFSYPEDAEEGGLMAYGVDLADNYRKVAGYVDRILKGANPGDLPIQQADRFRLVINLKTAKVLGLAIPISLLSRADEVIE